MKTPFNSSILPIAAVLGLLAGPLTGQVPVKQPQDGTTPLQITRVVLPIYPQTLRQQGIREGEVTVVFSVDANGRLEDVMALAYTNRGFYDASIVALKQWTFEPARNQGRPHPAVQFVSFNFEAGKDVVDMSAMDAAIAFTNILGRFSDEYRVMKLSELDAIPTPVSVASPGYPSTFIGSGISGDVTIEFYIDEQGRVRMPAIIDYTNLDFGSAAVDAVNRWSFEPPRRAGKPVAVMVQQRFHFKPSNSAD